MQRFLLSVCCVVVTPTAAHAQSLAPPRPLLATRWFLGVEGGVAQFRDVKLNVPAAAIRLDRALDRRGILRVGIQAIGMAGNTNVVGSAVTVEARVGSGNRFALLAGAGGGVFHTFAYEYGNEGYGYVEGGTAIRILPRVFMLLRASYGDAASDPGPFMVLAGLELGLGRN